MIKTTVAALILLASISAMAFQVEESTSQFSISNGVAVLQVPGITYTIAEIPPSANRMESATTPDDYPGFGHLTTGSDIAKDEALGIVEQFYKHTAIDFSSIAIRDFRVGAPQFVFWCSNPSLFGCLNREGRAGTWVEFFVNGANRSGGMTGFFRTILLIRKLPNSPAP